jgi:hypothetical protein
MVPFSGAAWVTERRMMPSVMRDQSDNMCNVQVIISSAGPHADGTLSKRQTSQLWGVYTQVETSALAGHALGTDFVTTDW